jgi:hypothetical protein
MLEELRSSKNRAGNGLEDINRVYPWGFRVSSGTKISFSVVGFVKVRNNYACPGRCVKEFVASKVKSNMRNPVSLNFEKYHISLLKSLTGYWLQSAINIQRASPVSPSVNGMLNFTNQSAAINALGITTGVTVRILGPFLQHPVKFRSLDIADLNRQIAHKSPKHIRLTKGIRPISETRSRQACILVGFRKVFLALGCPRIFDLP